jgi:hypothetical protein
MHRIRGKLTYSNVMVTILAIVVLGGGTAYAAGQLEKESVGTRQLQKEAVTPSKLSKASKVTLTGPTGATGATGARGLQGIQGVKGETGAPATALWASVNSNGTLAYGSGVTKTVNLTSGDYEVDFNRDISECGYATTPFSSGITTYVQPRDGNVDGVYVVTQNGSFNPVNAMFYVAVFC